MIFCVSYMRIHILMSDKYEAEIFDHDSVVPTTFSCKHFDLSLSFCSEIGKYSKRKKK